MSVAETWRNFWLEFEVLLGSMRCHRRRLLLLLPVCSAISGCWGFLLRVLDLLSKLLHLCEQARIDGWILLAIHGVCLVGSFFATGLALYRCVGAILVCWLNALNCWAGAPRRASRSFKGSLAQGLVNLHLNIVAVPLDRLLGDIGRSCAGPGFLWFRLNEGCDIFALLDASSRG